MCKAISKKIIQNSENSKLSEHQTNIRCVVFIMCGVIGECDIDAKSKLYESKQINLIFDENENNHLILL